MILNPILQQNRFLRSSKHRAFTLVEVLVVIAIMSVLMTIAAIGIGNLSAGKGTSVAISTSESLFEEARTIAVSKRCKARIMIDIDDETDERYLRRIVIAHQVVNADGTIDPDEWVLASRGYVMPQGTFFSQQYSKMKNGDDLPEENLTGSNVSTDFQGKYAYYEFNSEGIFQQPGAKFILGTGVRSKNQTEPQVTKAAKKDFAGFTIWRNGRTSTFRNVEQMGIPENPTTF